MATLGAVQSLSDLSTQVNPDTPQPKPTPLPSPDPKPLPIPQDPPVVGDPSPGLPDGVNFQILKSARTSDKEISIITKEGDKITLSAKSSSSITLGTYNAQGKVNGDQASGAGTAASAASERSLSISVEGDLNEQERKDIQKIVKGVNKALRDLFTGNVDDALQRASKLGNLDSISSFSASLTVTKSVEFTKGSNSPLQPTPGPEDVTDGGTDDAGETAPVVTAPPSTPAPITQPKVQELVRKIKNTIEDSGLKPELLKKPINDIFKSLLQDLKGQSEGSDSPKLKLAESLRQNIAEHLNKIAN